MTNAAIEDCPPVEVNPESFEAVWRFRGWESCDPPPDPDLDTAPDQEATAPKPATQRRPKEK